MRDARCRTFAIALAAVAMLGGDARAAADPVKVLRIASPDITSLDPQQGTDLYSTRVASHIFEALYQFDYFATPAKVIPNTAEALPEVTDGGKTWTMRVQKGILFADDPVFKGKPRELVAQDYVYSIRRHLDPNLRNGGNPALTELIVGARAVVDAARKPGAKMDYDAPIEGLRAIDRYTLQIRLHSADYTLLERLAGLLTMAVAREAIEAAGADVMNRPVGTGPYRLVEWRKASKVVLEANPRYRTVRYPESSDPKHKALVDAMRGKSLPQIGRIEVSIIEESQPELLAFMQGDLDLMLLSGDDSTRVLENGKLKPELAKKDPALAVRQSVGDIHVFQSRRSRRRRVFECAGCAAASDRDGFRRRRDDPRALRRQRASGKPAASARRQRPRSDAAAQVAVRPDGSARASRPLRLQGHRRRWLSRDAGRQAAHGGPRFAARVVVPRRRHAVEEEHGRDRNPNATEPADVRRASQSDARREAADVQSRLPVARALRLPDAADAVEQGAARHQPTGFKRPEYDAAYEAFLRTPSGTERTALARKMSELSQAWMPMILHTYGVGNVVYYPWLSGYWPSQFGASWKYADLDVAKRKAAANGR